MKSPIPGAAAAALLLLAGAAQAQVPPPALNSAATTPDFIKTAGASDLFEIREGKLAADRSQDPRVRAFAEQMVQAHMQTTEAMKQAIHQAGLPEPPAPELGPGQKIMIDELKDEKGRDFDHLYLVQQAGAHHEALGVMQTYAAQGDTPALRQAAAMTAPLVGRHLAEVIALQQPGQ